MPFYCHLFHSNKRLLLDHNTIRLKAGYMQKYLLILFYSLGLSHQVLAQNISAVFDQTLKIPVCNFFGSSCDSEKLLVGRGSVGPELNFPNTLGGTCADGNLGKHHEDESLDVIQIKTVDGKPFMPLKSVKVKMQVWAYSTGDMLDIYYANDITAANWKLIGTYYAAKKGFNEFTAVFDLENGTQTQAIRGNFRLGGNANPCTQGNYNDHDDLGFKVSLSNDSQPPSIEISVGGGGPSTEAPVEILAEAKDNMGISNVEFFADGKKIGTLAFEPYIFYWSPEPGIYQLKARATDFAGNTTYSKTVTIEVKSSPPGIINGDFENKTKGWTLVGAAKVDGIAGGAHSGDSYLALTPSKQKSADAYQDFWVPSSGGKLHVWVKVVSQDLQPDLDQLKFGIVTPQQSVYQTFTNQNNGNYIEEVFDLSMFAGRNIRLIFQSSSKSISPQTVYLVDDLKILF